VHRQYDRVHNQEIALVYVAAESIFARHLRRIPLVHSHIKVPLYLIFWLLEASRMSLTEHLPLLEVTADPQTLQGAPADRMALNSAACFHC
jgi:hypothetical protein